MTVRRTEAHERVELRQRARCALGLRMVSAQRTVAPGESRLQQHRRAVKVTHLQVQATYSHAAARTWLSNDPKPKR